MSSTFMGLEIGKRGLASHQQALHVTGHNISNAENKEYSRQRVIIKSADPIYIPSLNRGNVPGNIGQGSVVSQVERIRDAFVDDRIVKEKNAMGYWKTKDNFIKQIEMIYNEPSAQGIRSRLDQLWKSWQALSKHPEERSTRAVVKEKAVHLANEVQHLYRQLYDLQQNANRQIEHKVKEVNLLGKNIRALNERILKSEAVGDNPNDLKDKRDALIEKLSSIVNITIGRSDKDELIVYIGSENFVQGEVIRPLTVKMDPDKNGMFSVQWEDKDRPGKNKDIQIKGGELGGLLEIRDKHLRNNINDLNAFAINLVDLTNEVHRDGFSRRNETNINFFTHLNISDNSEGNFDLDNDGVADSTAIFKIAGNNKVDASAAIGINGTLTLVTNDTSQSRVNIDYKSSDTVLTVMKKINDARTGVVAYINHNKEFTIKATIAKDKDKLNFMIRHLEDSNQFLVGLTGILKNTGPQGAFDYRKTNEIRKLSPFINREHITIAPKFNPAAYMSVSANILKNIDNISAAQGKDIGGKGDFNKSNGVGDGSNALRIARLKHLNTMVDSSTTFNDFYTALIGRIGAQGQEAKDRVKNQETMLKNLNNLRESVSGVNLDEEMANMVAFQHGYNAAARVISTMDRMLDTIINRMGV